MYVHSKQMFCNHCYHVFTCACCDRKFAVKYAKFGYKPQYCGLKCFNSSKKNVGGARKVNIDNIDVDIDISKVISETRALGVEIDNSMTKPGVWGLYDENGNLLDVAQTTNITNEWKIMPSKFSKPKFVI